MKLPMLGVALIAAIVSPLAGQSPGPSVTRSTGGIPAACSDSTVPPTDLRDAESYRPVQRRGIAVPVLRPGQPGHGRVQVEFLVDARGRVDSVAIAGDLTAEFRQSLRSTLMTHTFWPAVYRGCAVPGRMSIELAFE